MKKLIGVVMSVVMIISIVPMMGIEVKATDVDSIISVKTDLQADSVVNAGEGYGELRRDNFDEGQTEIALINKDGNVLSEYKASPFFYKVKGNYVSLTGAPNSGIEYDNYAPELWYNDDSWNGAMGLVHLDDMDLTITNPISDGLMIGYKKDDSLYYFERKAVVTNVDGKVLYEFPEEFNISWICDFGGSNGTGNMYIGKKNENELRTMMSWYGDGLILFIDFSLDEYGNRNVEKIKYYDTEGNKIIESDKYKNASRFSEGIAWVYDGSYYGYIDKSGNEVIPCQYEYAGVFSDGLAYVKKDDKYGYINKDGEVVIPFEWDSAYSAADGLATVVKDGKCGLVDYNNQVVVPLEYDDISTFEGGVAYAIKDSYVYIIKVAEEDLKFIGNGSYYSDEVVYGDLHVVANRDGDSDEYPWQSVSIVSCDRTAQSVEIPSTIAGLPVNDIYPEAFSNSLDLTKINVASDSEYFSSIDGVLFDRQQTKLITYPIGKVEASYTIPEGVKDISISSFQNAVNLKSINIPKGVTDIPAEAFSGCESLVSIDIPSTVECIWIGAFYNCSSLKSIKIPKNLTIIRDMAFYNCNQLADVYYEGTETDKNSIEIGSYNNGNSNLLNATWHYNYTDVPTSTEEPSPTPTAEPTVTPTTEVTPTATTQPTTEASVTKVTKPKKKVTKPKKAVIKSAKNSSKKKIKLTLKKLSASGYQIQIATTKKFTKGKKTYSTAKTSYNIKKLKKGKTYYIRVRAYNKDGSKKLYGSWSKVKKVKITK